MWLIQRFIAFGLALAMLGLPSVPAWGDDGAGSTSVATPTSSTTTTTTTTKKSSDCKPGQKMTKNGCVATKFRGLASLAPPPEQYGQGNQMLNEVKSTRPSFMSQGKPSDSDVQLTGVCHGTDGSVVYSGQKGYSECLDSYTTGSGNVSDYFSAYRNAGVGIQVK